MNLENRRNFIKTLMAAAGGMGAARAAQIIVPPGRGIQRPPLGGGSPATVARQASALAMRQNATLAESKLPLPLHVTNGDETLLPGYIGQFSKGLPHSQLGEVDPAAYRAMMAAATSGSNSDWDQLPRGSGRKFVNPMGGDEFSLIGADPFSLYLDPPPAFSSAAQAAEMVELYWQALTRDVNFSDYDSDPLIHRATVELNQMSDYRGPRDSSNRVTAANIFRGVTAGDLAGPYVSQFLLKPVPMNSGLWPQLTRVGMPGVDYLQTYSEWTLFQSGLPPFQTEVFDPVYRYIRNGRDLAQWVHYDFIHQAYQNAALILLDNRPETSRNRTGSVFSDTNPYKSTVAQTGYVTFDVGQICALMGVACMAALKAAWYQKWRVHRRLRPETMAGRVHNNLTGAAAYPIHPELLNSDAVDLTHHNIGTYLLPQAFVEGCPLHPSYPSGHATVAGAEATLLKAFFNEQAPVPNPVVVSADGLSLLPYTGAPLTIGNEANKLAFNAGMGRDWSGIHYRSDAQYGILLGEQVAIGLLRDTVNCMTENFAGFKFTKFNGDPISIVPA